MIYVYCTELRRSALRWWLPVLVAIDLAVLYGRARWWIGIWPQTSVAAQIPAFYFGPFFAALAAWSVGRASRHGTDEQLDAAARPRWQAESLQLAGTVTYGLAVYLVGIVAAAITSTGSAGPGFLWPGYLCLGAATIVGCAAAGHAVGRWSRSRVIAPMFSALVCFVLLGSLGDSLGLIVLTGPPDARVAAWPLVTRLLLAAGAAVVAVAVPRPRFRPRGGRRPRYGRGQAYASAAALAVVVGCLAAYATAGSIQVSRPSPARYPCTNTTPASCVWPDDQKYLPQMSAMMSRLNEIPAGLFTVPPRYYERGLRAPRYQYVDFTVPEGAMWEVATGIAIQIVNATFPNPCAAATDADTAKQIHAQYELGTWLESRLTGAPQPPSVHGGPPGVDIQAIGKLIYTQQGSQLTWVRQRLATLRNTPCA
ncbi:hypothetical protein [Frankia sp. AgB32]|uniref:hypothetical protein n=1 Tax=Frankia sp. AgB32 TaxID=631119 RepID=UPI00200FBE37|nr:hypothetical protein [Frankia sp. AgB32]MCK9897958.1 hypothetical protein [Frankia sp. AgB32]